MLENLFEEQVEWLDRLAKSLHRARETVPSSVQDNRLYHLAVIKDETTFIRREIWENGRLKLSRMCGHRI